MQRLAEAGFVKQVAQPAVTAVKAAVVSTGLFAFGFVILCVGLQSELSRWISNDAASMLIGAALVGAAMIVRARQGAALSADVYFGRGQTILLEREKIKRRTFEKRRLHPARTAA